MSCRERPCFVRAALLALLLAALATPRASAWGFTAHRMIHRKAIATLPEPLRGLFERNAAFVVEHAIDPDLERTTGNDPGHFLDMDAFGAPPFDGIPHAEKEHLARNGEKAAERGRVPWRVDEVYRELVEALRTGDTARALTRAAALGHYASDAHVPFHAALNYDGQLSGQQGIHSRWESGLMERFERQIDAAAVASAWTRVDDPVEAIFGVLADSYARHLDALASDRASAGAKDLADTPQDDRYADAYFSKLYEREGPSIAARVARAATLTASLWESAWEDAGRPKLDPTFRFPYVRRQAKAILVSLDGAPASLVEEAVGRGLMPSLAALRKRGSVGRAQTTSPSKTALGHAALWTGAWPDVNGIAGNVIPLPSASITESNTGYTSTHLEAEPIWVTAARQGLEVTVVSAPQVYPFAPFLQERRFGGSFGRGLTLLDGYQNLRAEERVLTAKDLGPRPAAGWLGTFPAHEGELLEVELSVAGTRIDGLLYDDPADPAKGLDTLYLTLDKDAKGGVTLKPTPPRGADASAFAGLSVRVAGGDAPVYFRLFALSADGQEILLYHAAPSLLRSNRPRVETAAYEATGGFVGNGAWLYERGGLGPTLWQGGDGTAERRYLETAALVTRQFTRLTDFAIDRTAFDLLLTYLPNPDEALHLWWGRLDPALSGHDAALATRLRPFLDEALAMVDRFVGRLAERAGTDMVFAIASDHGMAAVNHSFKPNVALQRAGLLSLRPDGSIDLSRTQAMYFSGNSTYVLLNRASRPNGVVKPEDEARLVRQVTAALRGVVDPRTGKPVVRAVLEPSAVKPVPGTSQDRSRTAPAAATAEGLGGPHGGDLYLSMEPGYWLSGSTGGEPLEEIPPRADHFADPERPTMHATLTFVGPGVSEGRDFGLVRLIDVAPTLSALIGIEPPANASGKVIAPALARR
jgi:hypothetical protein